MKPTPGIREGVTQAVVTSLQLPVVPTTFRTFLIFGKKKMKQLRAWSHFTIWWVRLAKWRKESSVLWMNCCLEVLWRKTKKKEIPYVRESDSHLVWRAMMLLPDWTTAHRPLVWCPQQNRGNSGSLTIKQQFGSVSLLCSRVASTCGHVKEIQPESGIEEEPIMCKMPFQLNQTVFSISVFEHLWT